MKETAKKLRIFVVEDEVLLATWMEDILVDLGHEIAAVASQLPEGCEIARSGEFDLAILDVNLNGQPSYPIAEILRERGIPFVFATGYGGTGLDPAFKNVPTLAKPYVINDVERVLSSVMLSSNIDVQEKYSK
ncbi:response regulator [Rhizobium sp. CNPSo 4039]|uniref:response regulator n=1 Tax=Rhizobium sp. CNPSo 4039 TaxID=3021409 RepID=UPI000DDF8432|nr:response regulator [Rhizobium sp. CNPSo 4039]MDK4713548.1 response regulator [Rhizobium sp. CNPSo 4039]